MKGRIRNIICATATAIVAASCTSNDCPLNNTVSLICGFYNSNDGSAISIGNTLTVTLRDSIILNRSIGASTIALPMSYSAETDTLVFVYSPVDSIAGISDTLTLSKTNQAHFISLECGTKVFHTITAVNHTLRTADKIHRYAIDSIVVSNPNVNFDGQENLKIYYTVVQ